MIRPASLLKLTPLYVHVFFLLLLLSLVLKLFGRNYTDLLIFYAFPGLISGVIFQLYPTIQGYSIRGEVFTYAHMLLWIGNTLYYLLFGKINTLFYFTLPFLHMMLLVFNTKKLKDPIVLFILTGSLFYLLSGVFVNHENRLFLKHLITVGYFMPVIVGSYYVFVPMLQLESLDRRYILWINLAIQATSSILVSLSWYLSNYTYLSYSGIVQLLSVGVLSYGVYDTLNQRRGPLKGLDVSVKFLILGLFLCWFYLLIGVSIAGIKDFGLFMLHSDGMLYGFLTVITVGASYHILPFLFWWKFYAPKMGKEKVPTLKQVLDVKVAERLLILIPPMITGLLLGNVLHPYMEKLFSFLLFLTFGYYTFRITPLVLKTLLRAS